MGVDLPGDEIFLLYLLGQLSEREQSQLEEKYFSDDGAFERLRALEDELIDRYVRGELSGARRERFEKRFLQSPQQRKRITFARSLLLRLPGTPVTATVPPFPEKARAWWPTWLPLWPMPRLAVFMPAALGLLAVIVLGTWWLRHPRAPSEARVQQPPRSQTEQAARVPAEASPQAPKQPSEGEVAALILAPGITRGGGSETRLVIPSNANVVELTASLEIVEYETYRAEIRTVAGQEIWSEKGLHPRETPFGKGVITTVPAKLLTNRDYILTLRGLAPSGRLQVAAEYSFRAVRR